MTQVTSIATSKRYTVSQVCHVWKIPRSTLYHRRSQGEGGGSPARRRGPPGPCSDDELVKRIRAILAASPFHGEGYRKVWARLRHGGTRTSKERVRRLMRREGLRAPYHPRRERGSKAHDRRITTDLPDEMWGTDATRTLTDEGTATIFLLVDHCTSECLGLHASRSGTRFEALEPIRQATRSSFGAFDQGVAAGVSLRHDHGSQYMSHHFQEELRFLGIRSSPAFVAEPECNGVAERFVRTLKEQLLWMRHFATVEELRVALLDFMRRYNNSWLVRKHGHITPHAARERLLQARPQAA